MSSLADSGVSGGPIPVDVKPTQPSKLVIGDQEYQFKFELEPLMFMEEKYEIDVMDGSVFKGGLKVRNLVRLIVAGLTFEGSRWPGMGKPPEEQITLVARGVDMADIPHMIDVTVEEFKRCFPKAAAIIDSTALAAPRKQ